MGTMGLRKRGRTGPTLALLALVVPALVLGAATRSWAVPTDVPRATASFNDVVFAVAAAGNTIYVGGAFTRATDATGTVIRNHVAAVDANTGQLRAWNPNADGAVRALAVAGDDVYLGGAFAGVGGVAVPRIAKVSAATGNVRRGFVHRMSGTVRALVVDGGAVYAGGSFGSVDGQSRSRLAKFDALNGGLASGWRPSANGSVRTLAVASSGRILVGGNFTELDGRAGSGFLAALDGATGAVLRGFDAHIGYRVEALAVTTNAVFAAADGPGGHLRAFRRDGADLWDLPTDGGVQAVDVLDGTVYFGGHFDNACASARIGTTGSCHAGMLSRHKLAAASLAGETTPWAPQANSALGVLSVASVPASARLAVGGAFTRFGGGRLLQPHFAVFG